MSNADGSPIWPPSAVFPRSQPRASVMAFALRSSSVIGPVKPPSLAYDATDTSSRSPAPALLLRSQFRAPAKSCAFWSAGESGPAMSSPDLARIFARTSGSSNPSAPASELRSQFNASFMASALRSSSVSGPVLGPAAAFAYEATEISSRPRSAALLLRSQFSAFDISCAL